MWGGLCCNLKLTKINTNFAQSMHLSYQPSFLLSNQYLLNQKFSASASVSLFHTLYWTLEINPQVINIVNPSVKTSDQCHQVSATVLREQSLDWNQNIFYTNVRMFWWCLESLMQKYFAEVFNKIGVLHDLVSNTGSWDKMVIDSTFEV